MKIPGGLKLTVNVVTLALACVTVAETLVFVSDLMVRPPLEGLENQIFDLAFQVRKENTSFEKISSDSIIIIDIDDASIEKLGRAQLWPRSYDARVIDNVAYGEPRAIGIDFLYTEPDTLSPAYAELLMASGFENSGEIIKALSTDRQLATAITKAKNVYLSFFDDDEFVKKDSTATEQYDLRTIKGSNETLRFPKLNHPVLPVDSFADNAKAVGSISMPSMQDGTVRYYHLLQQLPSSNKESHFVGNFPLYMVMDELGVTDSEVEIQDDGIQLGSKAFIPLRADGTFRLNWMGSDEKIRYISYYKVLNDLVPSEFYTGKFVFFGTSAAGLQDLKTIPSRGKKMPGVEVHAVALLNMMNQAFIREVSERQALPYFFLFSVILVFAFLHIRPLWGFVSSMVLIFVEMSFFVLWILPDTGTVFPVVTLMVITFLAYISASLFTYFIKEKKNRELRSAFGRYVSPLVVDQIMKKAAALHLGGQKKRLTVLFSDIRGFTKYSEQLDPQELVIVLNNYLSQMSEVVFKYSGTIDKFIGDAIMAVFGAPIEQEDHADRACRVAIGMIHCLENVNRDQALRGQPPLAIGIGLNTGDMTVGNIGSQRRFDYTVIGDAVNLGSRLEDLTKFFRVGILVSEMTKESCSQNEFLFRELSSVKVKGKDTPVVVYQLIGTIKDNAESVISLPHWNEAYHTFKRGELEKALELFHRYHEMRPGDSATLYYIERCKEYIAQPDAFSLVLKMGSK